MNAPAAAPPFGLAPRAALLQAAMSLWVPVLVPIVTGMLRDCGHCQTAYLLSLPLVPGILAPVLCGLDDAWFFVVGGAVTLLLFGLVALCLFELPRRLGHAVQTLVVLGVALEAIGYASLLRA